MNRLYFPRPAIPIGCQTCSVIYYAYKDGFDLAKVKVFARIISTNETETINSIVSANNNQNQVHDMINEITKEYHKKLELFFRNYEDTTEQKHVYYERRSKSLAGENICGYQKCTFRSMIQSAVAVWFESPYEATGSEQVLLSQYRNQVFSDNQKEICYYASASLYSAFDRIIYENRLDSSWRTAKPFICFLIKKSLTEEKISLNDTEKSEALAHSILNLIKNNNDLLEELEKALNIYAKAKELFKKQNPNKNMGDYLNSQRIMSYILGARNETVKEIREETQNPTAVTYTGKIIRIGRDRNGLYYLFINTGDASLFAHQNFSPDINFTNMQSGQTVIYEMDKDKFDRDIAVRVRK